MCRNVLPCARRFCLSHKHHLPCLSERTRRQPVQIDSARQASGIKLCLMGSGWLHFIREHRPFPPEEVAYSQPNITDHQHLIPVVGSNRLG